MLASKNFAPLIKDTPAEAEVISHQLLLRSGMIRKVASGIYNWLPLGFKTLKLVAVSYTHLTLPTNREV